MQSTNTNTKDVFQIQILLKVFKILLNFDVNYTNSKTIVLQCLKCLYTTHLQKCNFSFPRSLRVKFHTLRHRKNI